MAMMVRPAVAERNYYVPRVQSYPPPPQPQSQSMAVADNIYVPVQSLPPSPPPPPLALEHPDNAGKPSQKANYYYAVAEVVLRVLYFVFSLAALLILLTSKQTIVYWSSRTYPQQAATSTATFTQYSPTFRYFMVAVAASSLYSVITTILAFINLFNKDSSRSRDLLTQFISTLDTVMLGIVGSASGAASAITYVGLRGNDNLDWDSICDYYDTFCFHIGFSVISALLASLVLIILVSFSVSSLTNRLASSYSQLRTD